MLNPFVSRTYIKTPYKRCIVCSVYQTIAECFHIELKSFLIKALMRMFLFLFLNDIVVVVSSTFIFFSKKSFLTVPYPTLNSYTLEFISI